MLKPMLVSLLVACSSSPPDGQRLFTEKGCDACHSVDGTPRIGPTLKAAFGHRVQLESGETVFDEAYFVESVMAPDAKIVMGYPRGAQPSFAGQIDDGEMKALLAYVKTL